MQGPISDALRTPGVASTFATSLFARLPFAAVTVLLVLQTRELDGSYATAGLVVAAYAVTSGVTEPLIARVADRRGQTRVLVATVPVNAVAFGFAATATSPGTLAIAGVLIGASYPQVGGMMRTLLVHLIEDERRRSAAFSLETVGTEVLFIAAPPILVAGVAAHAGPGIALAIGGALTFVGSSLFAASRPSRAWRPAARATTGPARLGTASYRLLVAVTLGFGFTLGLVDVALTAFAEHEGRRAAVGWLLALGALGSLIGGIAATRLPVAHSPAGRLAALLTAQALTTLLLASAHSLTLMAVVVTLNGLTVSPAMASVFSLVARAVPDSRLTEGFAWLGTGLMVGAAVGAGIGGFVITHGSVGWTFALAGVALTVAAATARFRLASTLAELPTAEATRPVDAAAAAPR